MASMPYLLMEADVSPSRRKQNRQSSPPKKRQKKHKAPWASDEDDGPEHTNVSTLFKYLMFLGFHFI